MLPATITPTPMHLLSMAMNQGADLDKLQQLMALQERWEANEARKAFNAAFSDFKSEAIQIIRTKQITDGPLKGKKHAELGNIVSSVSPALSKYGLSISWKLTKDEKDWMEVTCILRHVSGHAESVSMGGAPDAGPGRNAIQARGSAKTYLERYTALGILGLAPEDEDTDGMANGISSDAVKRIEECQNLAELNTVYREEYKAAKTKGEMAAIITAKDKRKAELGGAQ